MSPSRKRSSQPSIPPSSTPPELKAPPRPAMPETELEDIQAEEVVSSDDVATLPMDTAAPTDPEVTAPRQHPIPPPSEPKQYRAIGLVRGRYQPGEEQLSTGMLNISADNYQLPAILLGRVLSLVKNHLDLDREYLWVVYPRFINKPRPKTLSLQVVGVWEPALLNRIDPESEDISAHPSEELPDPEAGYFSIRGEVVGFSEEEQEVTVNIRQMPRKPSQEERAFKLTLHGQLTGKVLGHFWDLDVQLQNGTLEIRNGTCIGFVAPKKRKPSEGAKPDSRGKFGQRKPTPQSAAFKAERPTDGEANFEQPVRRDSPLSRPTKPIKKTRPQ